MLKKKFLEKRHPDSYKVYNLCIEREYDLKFFNSRVARFPFIDHQAPPIELMQKFSDDITKWLSEDSKHVAAVHCKAGKGRAGMMICCYLLHSKQVESAKDAMELFAKKRTHDGEGVTIPSQKRYIGYYEQILKHGMPEQPTITLNKLVIATSKYSNTSVTPNLVISVLRGKGGDEKKNILKL